VNHNWTATRKPSLEEICRAIGGEICGEEVLAPGPGHSDKDRSLCVKLSRENNRGYIVHSFSGDDPIRCRDYVAEKLGQPAWAPAPRSYSPVMAEYVYRDENGAPHLRVQRTADKEFFQSHWNGSGWEKGAPKDKRIPYRFPELLAADPSKPIYVVEGEKDADRLASLDLIATTSSGGSNGKWTPELSKHFAGRSVRIIPDNDEPGAKYAQKVAENLFRMAASVRIVELPGLGSRVESGGRDISDWLNLGNTLETLEAVASDARDWAPPTPKGGWCDHVFTAASLQHKTFEPIAYIIPMLIPEGSTILAGRPKVGKSWLALDVALATGAGRYVLGDIKLEEGDVLYAALEDNQRRLRSRIGRLLAHRDEPWPTRLTLATWRRLDAGGLADAKEWAGSVPKPRLMIFDTLAGVRPDRNSRDTLYEGDYRALVACRLGLIRPGLAR
jgi:hypothetical protein